MADVKENKNPQGFYFNQQACIGCRTCQVWLLYTSDAADE